MSYIEYSVKDRIGFITLNRPEKRNALSFELIAELKAAFKAFENNEQVKIIVLRAQGPVFSAGADLAYLQQLQNFSYEENLADSQHLKELKNAGIIQGSIEGVSVCYCIEPKVWKQYKELFNSFFKEVNLSGNCC